MKITVCGKGGSGKSTLSTLLAQQFAKQGKRVLVIDGDESNYGLHQMLGKEQPADYIDELGGKDKVTSALMQGPQNIPNFFEKRWNMDTLPEGYSPSAGEIKLMSVGKIHNDNEGCACPFNAVLMQLIGNLDLGPNDVAIIDMEAGIEHFGRGTDNFTDLILMIVDPTAESIKLAAKVHELAQGIGKPVRYILNKTTDASRELMYEQIDDKTLIAAEIPMDSALYEAGLTGKEIHTEITAMDNLIATLEEACA